jgi:hypothetical protein
MLKQQTTDLDKFAREWSAVSVSGATGQSLNSREDLFYNH